MEKLKIYKIITECKINEFVACGEIITEKFVCMVVARKRQEAVEMIIDKYGEKFVNAEIFKIKYPRIITLCDFICDDE